MRVKELRYARLFNFPGRYENERIELVFELDEHEDPKAAWARAYDMVHTLHEVGEAIRRFREIEDSAWEKVKHLAELIDSAHREIGRWTAEVEKWKARAEEERKEKHKISRATLCQLGDAEERLDEAKKKLAEYEERQAWYRKMAERAEELGRELSKAMRDADFNKVQELLTGPVAEFVEIWHQGPGGEDEPDWW